VQQRPDLIALLEAVGRFLRDELPGAIADERLRFRVLVAASLVGQAAAELGAEDALLAAERDQLTGLLGRPGAGPAAGRNGARAELAELDAELARRIRAGEIDPAAARSHLQAALGRLLQVINPRFDLSAEIDGEEG